MPLTKPSPGPSAGPSAGNGPRAQRARGRVGIGFGAAGLRRLRQQGCARCLLPRIHAGDAHAVVINTAGGLTGGDRFEVEAELDEAARLVLTTQAAERIYRSAGGRAEVTNRLSLAPGARIAWLPQETILFDRAALERRLEVDLAPDARFLGLEMLALGRRASGEAVSQAHLTDHWRIRRAGRLIHAEALRLTGDIGTVAPRAGLLDGARALAVLVLVAPQAEALLEPVRALLPGASGDGGLRAAASAWEGRLVVRLLAEDLRPLKAALGRLLEGLPGGAVPRVWQI